MGAGGIENPIFPLTFKVYYPILSNQIRKHQGVEYFVEIIKVVFDFLTGQRTTNNEL